MVAEMGRESERERHLRVAVGDVEEGGGGAAKEAASKIDLRLERGSCKQI